MRYVWQKQKEEYYYSVIDVVHVLTEIADEKMHLTDIAAMKQLLRIIQSIPSPNAGGTIAGNARKELENALGRSVITSQNANDFKRLEE